MQRFTIPCEELRHFYCHEAMTTTALAQHYGCSPTTIANRLKRCGIPTRSARFRSANITVAVLRDLYYEQRLSIAAIARQLGVSISTIHNHRRALGIPRRPRYTT